MANPSDVRSRLAAVAIGLASLASAGAAALPNFPGAEGFGSQTPGGRGGAVLYVTNTNDSGPGSLREAIETRGPRIVLFKTGGTIVLQSTLRIDHPKLTIAGQSAPGGGIQIRNDDVGSSRDDSFPSIAINADDVVIRYLRVRPGMLQLDPDPACQPPWGRRWKAPAGKCVVPGDIDAITSPPKGVPDATRRQNVLLDHVSLGFATDEILGLGAASNWTLQDSIVAEGLDYMLYEPPRQRNGKGMLIGNGDYARAGNFSGRISLHHNLWAHNVYRNPMALNGCRHESAPSNALSTSSTT